MRGQRVFCPSPQVMMGTGKGPVEQEAPLLEVPKTLAEAEGMLVNQGAAVLLGRHAGQRPMKHQHP